MAKNEKQKLKPLYLKQILEEYTDENHGLTLERLLGLLEQKGIKAERKSIYDDIFVLAEDFNMGIELDKSKRPPEYKLLDRQFELPELKMMVDSIASSKFLSEAKTKTLIQKKLETLCSSYQARALNREVTLANRVKSMNNTIHINVDQLHTAIAENTQVKFRYFDYDLNKQRRYFKKGKCYVVSPWRMLYADDNYYLLAWDAKEEKFKHFRVDKMDSVEQMLIGNIRVAREGVEAFDKLDMSAYTKYTFSMFGGEIEHVTMIFQNRMMGTVMDRFGRDVVVLKEDERHFRITVPVAVSQQFFGWVFSLGKTVRIVAPEAVKKKMKASLEEISKRYSE